MAVRRCDAYAGLARYQYQSKAKLVAWLSLSRYILYIKYLFINVPVCE